MEVTESMLTRISKSKIVNMAEINTEPSCIIFLSHERSDMIPCAVSKWLELMILIWTFDLEAMNT